MTEDNFASLPTWLWSPKLSEKRTIPVGSSQHHAGSWELSCVFWARVALTLAGFVIWPYPTAYLQTKMLSHVQLFSGKITLHPRTAYLWVLWLQISQPRWQEEHLPSPPVCSAVLVTSHQPHTALADCLLDIRSPPSPIKDCFASEVLQPEQLLEYFSSKSLMQWQKGQRLRWKVSSAVPLCLVVPGTRTYNVES